MEASKVLLISTCKHPLHEFEFVRPLENICLKLNFKYVIKHISKINEINSELESFSKIIICGTALKDFEYEKFDLNLILKLQMKKIFLC